MRRPIPSLARGWLLPLALAAATLSPLSTRAAEAPRCSLQSIALPVTMRGMRPVVTLELNGTPMPLLVDTGAFFSILTDAAAEQLHLSLHSLPRGLRITGATGDMKAKVARVERVGLAGGTVPNVEFLVGLNELGQDLAGVLGNNFLGLADAEYDLAHGVVRLMFPQGDCQGQSMAYWAGDQPVNTVALHREQGGSRDTSIRVVARLNGRRVTALLDTGAPVTTIRLSIAHDVGLRDEDLVPGDRIGGAGAGHVRSWIAALDTFEVGEERVLHNAVTVDDTGRGSEDMILGVDYFLSHHVYVSRLQGRLFATWNGGPVFGLNRVDAKGDAADAPDAKEADPTTAEGWALRGAARLARRDLDRALADLDHACAMAPAVAAYHGTRARIHQAMKHRDLALKDLDEALRIAPDDAFLRLMRAWMRQEAGDTEGTRQDLKQLDATQPSSSNHRDSMGHLYSRIGQGDDALRQWDLWLGAHLQDGQADTVFNARCWLRMSRNQALELALKDCLAAVDLDGDHADFRDSLGWVLLRMDRAAKAREAFDKALALQPGRAMSLFGRGLALLKLGEQDAGRRDLAAARAARQGIDAEVKAIGMAAPE